MKSSTYAMTIRIVPFPCTEEVMLLIAAGNPSTDWISSGLRGDTNNSGLPPICLIRFG